MSLAHIGTHGRSTQDCSKRLNPAHMEPWFVCTSKVCKHDLTIAKRRDTFPESHVRKKHMTCLNQLDTSWEVRRKTQRTPFVDPQPRFPAYCMCMVRVQERLGSRALSGMSVSQMLSTIPETNIFFRGPHFDTMGSLEICFKESVQLRYQGPIVSDLAPTHSAKETVPPNRTPRRQRQFGF